THTYAQPGQYHACLVVWSWDPTTQDSCFADHCEWVTIQGGSPCDSLYQVSYTYGQQNNVAFFTAHATLPTQNYYWDFGDGSTGTGAQQQHSFLPGQYYVCLYGWTGGFNTLDSCMASFCDWIVVQGDSTSTPCDSTNALFQVTMVGPTAFFHNVVANPAIYYEWSFGDGSTATGIDPSHTYTVAGQYQACLTAWAWDPMTQDTCVTMSCHWITVQGSTAPCDSMWVPSFNVTVGDAAFFLTSTTITGNWDNSLVWLADGNVIGTGPDLIYHPNTTGYVLICLQASLYDDAQQLVCSGTVCDSVSMFDPPTGIDEPNGQDGISIYPQPFTDQLVVNAQDLTGAVRATLLDMAGRLVDDRRVTLNGPTTLDYAGLPAGTYVLRLQGNTGERVVRVLKN
ncbi:MAG TPA: PKD domain-containing protein, partial [Flavobacteriales bacterium]|nr:PKD domain-containing protein [Flavobacteriales bacterium]